MGMGQNLAQTPAHARVLFRVMVLSGVWSAGCVEITARFVVRRNVRKVRGLLPHDDLELVDLRLVVALQTRLRRPGAGVGSGCNQ